jgi:pyrroline-5-carboxylate reductase
MKILVIGAGKMGLAMISCWSKSNFSETLKIVAIDSNKKIRDSIKKKFKKVSILEKLPENWTGEILVLAVKPQAFSPIAKEMLKRNIQTKVIISIMAGIKIKTISASLKIKTEIIRVMPNLASELGLGVNCIYHNKNINHRYLKNIKKLLKELGSVYVLKNEKLIDAVTAISGSGPAYFFLFFLVFESIAKEIGFNKEEARNLIIDTALGSLELVKHEVNIRALINSVKSKGGTTEAALKVLEKNNKGLYNLMKSAINAANKRAQQLSKVN